MQNYRNMNGDSGVIGYETTSSSITVFFKDGSAYLYTNTSAGSHHIRQMQALAAYGNGLNSYINKNVKKLYSAKLR